MSPLGKTTPSRPTKKRCVAPKKPDVKNRAFEAIAKDATQALFMLRDRTIEELFETDFVTDMLPMTCFPNEECFDEDDRLVLLVNAVYDLLIKTVNPKSVESAIKKMRLKGRLAIKGKLNPKILNEGNYTVYHGERSVKFAPVISISANLDSILREQDYADNYEDLTAFEEAEEDEDEDDGDYDDREHVEKLKCFYETLFHHMFEGLSYTHIEEEEEKYDEEKDSDEE